MPDKKLTQLTPFSQVIETTDVIYKVNTGVTGSQASQILTVDARYIMVTGSTMAGALSLGNNELNAVNCVDFNTGFTGTNAVARLKWNNDDGTIEVGALGTGVVLQVGQESHVRAVNKEGSQINNGQAVTITGAQGSRAKVELSDPNDAPLRDSVTGLATENIANNVEGYITTFGLVRDLDTSAFSEGDRLFASATPGSLVVAPPVAPARKIFVGTVVVSNANTGSIFVGPVNVPNLSALSDVIIGGSIADNDFLSWHSASGTWVNQSPEPNIINADGTLGDVTTKFNTLLSQLENLGFLLTS